MAEMATYVGVTPRTIAASSAAALAKGVRVTRSSAGVCAVTAIGTRGDYTATLKIAPRYVNEKCTACGDCKPVCPTKSISSGKVFYKIDAATCTECDGHNDSPLCVDVCPSGCISPA